ncbi:MAG: mechanosensitive ion channel family protein [Cellvibrionaceae bacterium]
MKILITLAILVTMFVIISFVSKTVSKVGEAKSVKAYRVKYIIKIINLAVIILTLMLLSLLLGIEYSQLAVFLSSAFAVIGVALFAQWSILSNITASLVIFFGFPYRVGDRIKVIDKDDDITGVIDEITLFHVLIKRGNELITYPNTLILQKGVIKNPTPNNQSKQLIANRWKKNQRIVNP